MAGRLRPSKKSEWISIDDCEESKTDDDQISMDDRLRGPGPDFQVDEDWILMDNRFGLGHRRPGRIGDPKSMTTGFR